MNASRVLLRTLSVLSLALAGCSSSASPGEGGVPDAEYIPDVLPDAAVQPDAPGLPDVQTFPADVPISSDAPNACSPGTASFVRISYTGPRSEALDCSIPRPTPGGVPMVVTRTAAVVSAMDDESGTHVSLDFCSPAADCVPLIGSLSVSAPGFSLAAGPNALRPGQYVTVRSRATWSWGCTMQFEIANAPAWDGVVNHIRGDSMILAAGASGEGSALPDAPFGVARASIGCQTSGSNCGGGPPELFALSFQGSCRTCLRQPDPVLVRQGLNSMFAIDSNSYQVSNHRSFNSGACDDYWNYAWTIREIWLE